MKKMKLFVGMLAIAGLGFVSCNDDDDDNNTNNTDLGIAGTYNLIEVNTGAETDFNQDGTPHGNQIQESDCYNGSKIVFNSDGTFSYDIKSILVSGGNSACASSTVTGTWVLEGGTGTSAVITASYSQNGTDTQVTINKTGSELQIYSLFGPYPDRTAAGAATTTIGELELIFNKQ